MNPSQKGKKIMDPEVYTQTRHRDQGFKRVAALLSVLGPEQSWPVIGEFTPGEVAGILEELLVLAELTFGQQQKILEEFGCEHLVSPRGAVNGIALAEKIQAAFGL